MWGDYDHDGADSHCVNCGAPIYFEVGPGLSRCPACGKNPDKTPEQEAKEAAEWAEKARKMATDEFWIDEMERNLDSEIMSLEMQYVDVPPGVPMPTGACAKAKKLITGLKRLRTELRQ